MPHPPLRLKKALFRTATRFTPTALARRRLKNGVGIAHLGRSGSTVLGDLLSQHEAVVYHGEIYGNAIRRHVNDTTDSDPLGLAARPLLIDAARQPRSGRFLFEFLLTDLHGLGISVVDHADVLDDLGLKTTILLERKNLLRREVSVQRARATGVWHARSGATHATPTPAEAPITLDLTARTGHDLLTFFDRQQSLIVDVARAHGDRLLHLVYEQDIEPDPMLAYRKVVDFLWLAPSTPEIRYRKITTRPLPELIDNFDEVDRLFSGTRHEWMLTA